MCVPRLKLPAIMYNGYRNLILNIVNLNSMNHGVCVCGLYRQIRHVHNALTMYIPTGLWQRV